jgi:hypothetical protein
MPRPANKLIAYYVIGRSIVFMMRWAFFIGLFMFLFILGGKEGTLEERMDQLEPPRIKVIFPESTAHPPPPPGDLNLNYYTVVVAAETRREGAEMVVGQLRSARIGSKIITANGQHYVTVGKFLKPGAAKKTLQQVIEHGFVHAKISGKAEIDENPEPNEPAL